MQIGGHNHCHFHSLPTLTFQDLLSLLMATDSLVRCPACGSALTAPRENPAEDHKGS
jgi:hypothetical protein